MSSSKVSVWLLEHPANGAANQAKCKAKKLNAIPKWADLKKIAKFYARAEQLSTLHGVRFVVDHIVPLKSDTVCGLHCESNLQIITVRSNTRKGSRYVS